MNKKKFLNCLFLSLFLLFPLGQLEKLPLGIAGVSIYCHDLVLALIWFWLFFSGRPKKVFSAGRLKALKIFVLIAFFSWLVSLFKWGGETVLGLGYLVRWLLLAGVYLASSGWSDKEKNWLKGLIRRAVFLTAVFGWVQYLLLPDLRHLKYFGWDDHYYRLTGTVLDPNLLGIILVLGLGLEFGSRKKNILRKLFLLITLAFTYSRSSWLAWLVLLTGWTISQVLARPIKMDLFFLCRTFFRSLKVLTFYLWLVISLIIFCLLPRPEGEGGNLTRTASIGGRTQSWRNSWQVIKENPILGVGFNNYRLVQREKGFIADGQTDHAGGGVENSFLLVWATTGIIGLSAFLWWVSGLKPFWLILPVLIHALFNNSLFYPWVLILIWGIQSSEKN